LRARARDEITAVLRESDLLKQNRSPAATRSIVVASSRLEDGLKSSIASGRGPSRLSGIFAGEFLAADRISQFESRLYAESAFHGRALSWRAGDARNQRA